MKKLIFSIILSFLFFITYAQDTVIIKKSYYTISYNNLYKQPNYTLYTFNLSMIGEAKRANSFKVDTSVNCYTNKDYKSSGFDKGHITPAEDMSFSDEAIGETFSYDNVCPMYPSFNRGNWKMIENFVRKNGDDTLIIYTGSIIQSKTEINGLIVPDYFYKIIYNCRYKDAICYLVKHEKEKENIKIEFKTVREIEKLTGIDFFNWMSKESQDWFENVHYKKSYWKFSGD